MFTTHFSKLAVLATIALWSFTSCLKDNDNGYLGHEECWGTIIGTPTDFKIATDNGNTLNVVENLDPSFEVKDGARVVALLTSISKTGENSYDVRINAMKKLLTKDPVYFSELTPEEIENIGKDPIEVATAWFGAGRYLDIEFIIKGEDALAPHFINLVVDEERSTEEEVFVTLHHNSFGDFPVLRSWGRVSFDIAGLVPADKEKIKVTLLWKEYSGFQNSSSGIFTLHKSAEPVSLVGKGATKSTSASSAVVL